MSTTHDQRVHIAVIGAGPGGLCMGKRLLDEGVDDFVLLERSAGVGGTWNLNRYPGCECDVQSALYSFSFEIKPDWSKPYGTQPEILAYMRHVAQKYGLLPHVQLGNGVRRAVWDQPSATWRLTLDDGATVIADLVVSAIGMFNDLSWPDVDGLHDFAGTMFHSAQWNWDHEQNLELVTEDITRITPKSVITADGRERVVDTIIAATGFAATKYLSAIDVVGRNGTCIADAWNDGATAYLGITTAGFPNLFMLYGPNTNNGSILTMIEYQVEHIICHVRRIRDEHLAWVDVRPEPMARYNDEVQQAIANVPAWNANCNGYYRSPSGRIVTQWPFSMAEFRDRTASIAPADFEIAER